MNVLIDTNVALDVLLQRQPFFEHSQLVLLAAEHKYVTGFRLRLRVCCCRDIAIVRSILLSA